MFSPAKIQQFLHKCKKNRVLGQFFWCRVECVGVKAGISRDGNREVHPKTPRAFSYLAFARTIISGTPQSKTDGGKMKIPE